MRVSVNLDKENFEYIIKNKIDLNDLIKQEIESKQIKVNENDDVFEAWAR